MSLDNFTTGQISSMNFGFEGLSFDRSLTANPLFIDFAGGNYRLSQSSPYIDTAQGLNSTVPGLDRFPRGLDGDGNGTTGWDLGAYETFYPSADSDQDGLSDTNEIIRM